MTREDARALGKLIGQMEDVIKKLDDIEARMRALETLRWKAAGAAIVVGSLAGAATRLL